VKRRRLIAAALALVGGVAVASRLAVAGTTAIATATTSTSPTLQAWIDSGKLPDLRRPDFSDYRDYAREFYAAGGNALVWSESGWLHGIEPTPVALGIMKELENAEAKGLRAADYDGDRWPTRLARLQQSSPPATDADRVRFDLALTIGLMRYVSDLHIGRVNPEPIRFEMDVAQKKDDLAQFLRDEFVGAKPEEAPRLIAEVEPPYDGYRRLEKAVQIYTEIAAKDHGGALPPPAKTIAPGDSYAGLPRLLELLKLVGDLPQVTNVQLDPPIYQGPLVDAVKAFQDRHGLVNDGRLGRGTVAAMNVPLRRRAEQLRLTLERWRWAPRLFAQPPILVNIPEFVLRARGPDGQTQLRMRVVVGESLDHQTPVLSGKLRYVIFRPYWNVPLSIQLDELVPKIEESRAYLAENNYEVVTGDREVVTDGVVNDDVLADLRAGRVFIRQKPGPKNSLGLVKFVFPNEYNVYMHDTPSVALFAKSRRDFSHGCIRLQDPAALADWVLRGNPGWDRDRVIAAMQGAKDNVQVNLTQAIPVLVVYGTAVATQDGPVHFLNDIYSHDAELEQALARGYPYRSRPAARPVNREGAEP
jgi:murein L,D-transpeptidase YcbB/YkuD